MEVEFGEKFSKELRKVNDPKIKRSLSKFIRGVKASNDLTQIPKLKKLKGYKNIYRARIGDYRVGLIHSEDKLSFETILHRKDIYKKFP